MHPRQFLAPPPRPGSGRPEHDKLPSNDDQANPVGLQAALFHVRVAEEKYQSGVEYGRDWATNHAEADELSALERFKASFDGEVTNDWEWFFSEASYEGSAYGISELLYFAIHPEHDELRSASSDFWEFAVGDSPEDGLVLSSGAFVKGFAEGALVVWKSAQG